MSILVIVLGVGIFLFVIGLIFGRALDIAAFTNVGLLGMLISIVTFILMVLVIIPAEVVKWLFGIYIVGQALVAWGNEMVK